MADSFTCAICGCVHEGRVSDWAFRLPEAVVALAPVERLARVWSNSDLCEFGDRRFIRCLLDLPFTDEVGQFGWGVWAEVSAVTYDRYVELYDADAADEPPGTGWIANALPPYPGSLGRAVTIRFRDAVNRPLLLLPSNDEGRLARDQREGIDRERHDALLSALGHA